MNEILKNDHCNVSNGKYFRVTTDGANVFNSSREENNFCYTLMRAIGNGNE